MKKVCSSCGRNRRIGKFNNNSYRPDGKQNQCRECQRRTNKKASQKDRAKFLKLERDRQWKRENREKISEYNAAYYKKHKERIISRRNTESILIIENPDIKKINTSRRVRRKFMDDIVLNPQRKN